MSDTYPLIKRLLSHKDDPGESIPHTCRSNLLAELVRREKLNHLVLNLYTDDLGYTIAVRINSTSISSHNQPKPTTNGLYNISEGCSRFDQAPNNESNIVFETAKLSYEETSLLEFIDNEELPPLLIQLIDRSQSLCQYRIWHSGCLIIEIRDFRSASDVDKTNQTNGQIEYQDFITCHSELNHFDTNISYENYGIIDINKDRVQQSSHTSNFILLKPTNLSMFNDMINLMESQECDTVWSFQDRLHLESQIVLCNAPTLSLEPTESISSCTGNHLHYQKDTDGRAKQSKIFKRRSFNRKSIVSNAISNRRLNLPSQLGLQQFIEARDDRNKANNMEKFVSRLSSGNRCIAKLLRNRTLPK